jgi:hypothetical protein
MRALEEQWMFWVLDLVRIPHIEVDFGADVLDGCCRHFLRIKIFDLLPHP